MGRASLRARIQRIADTSPRHEADNSRACPAPPGCCPLAASPPLAGPATASQGRKPRERWRDSASLDGMALVWRAYVAGESTKDRREIVLKKLSRTFADIIRNSNGPDSIWAKSRIRSSREPSRFALISKEKRSRRRQGWCMRGSKSSMETIGYSKPTAPLLSCLTDGPPWTSRPMPMLTPFHATPSITPPTNATQPMCALAARNVQPNCNDPVAKPHICSAIAAWPTFQESKEISCRRQRYGRPSPA